MARPLRIEYPGAVYHVTSQGNERSLIFRDEKDRLAFLDTLARTVDRWNWIVHAYCLMSGEGVRSLGLAYSAESISRYGL